MVEAVLESRMGVIMGVIMNVINSFRSSDSKCHTNRTVHADCVDSISTTFSGHPLLN